MTQDEVQQQTKCIARLAEQLASQPRLQAELQRARREFFGPNLQGAGDDAAEHRFAEWFVIERESEVLGAIPITIPPFLQDAEELEGSLAGLFLVESVGDTVAITDVQDSTVLELSEQGTLQVGDLLVGRLYSVSGERWAPSAATPALRPGRTLAHAFARDLKDLNIDRRLLQIELEHLLLQKHKSASTSIVSPATGEEVLRDLVVAPDTPLEHLEADLEKLLLSSGDQHSATELSQALAVAAGPGMVIGPLLDQLAFDTDIDLDQTRRVLLEIWNAHHAGQARSTEEASSSSGPPGETLGESLVRRLDEGLGEREDVEGLFAQIEEIAGIEPDEAAEDVDERDTAIVDEVFPSMDDDGDAGDLSPLITEFYWEAGISAEQQVALVMWVDLQRNAAVPNTDFETIPAQDVMRLLLHVYLRSAPGERSERVRAAFAEVRKFYEWVYTAQEIDRRGILEQCQGALLEQLDRLQRAGVLLTTTAAPERSPGLLQIEEIGKDGFGARDDDGGSYWILASEDAVAQLAVGDILLGGFAGQAGDEPTSLHRQLAGMVVVLPIDARSLIE
jgi:hypothetical protein